MSQFSFCDYNLVICILSMLLEDILTQKSPTINYGTQGEEFLSDFLKCELKKIQKYNSEGSEL